MAMVKSAGLVVVCGILAVAAAACRQQDESARPAAMPEAGQATAPAAPGGSTRPALQSWLGRWNGPEGTWLELAASGDHYSVKIRTLDGETRYEGREAGDHIEFERSGVTESIRAGDGPSTGMKWLADKKDCLTIKSGEGYCRD